MHSSDISPSWIDRVLTETGVIGDDVAVTTATTAPIGTGQVADSIRVSVDYSAPVSAPSSFVVKATSDDEQSRAAGRSELNYLREVRFYRDLAPNLQVRVPHCYFGEIDSNNTEFTLLLEDLTPARPGDQMVGCSVAEVELAVAQAAGFHGPYWGSSALVGTEWLDISSTYWARFTEMMPRWWEGFVDRYRSRLSDDDIDLGSAFTGHIADYYRVLGDIPFTVQHGDFRPDNVLFDAAGGRIPLAVLDWQTVIFGPGVVDIAYFIGGALDAETRRRHEADLLSHYLDRLAEHGVRDYSTRQLTDDYAIGTFQNLIIGVAAAMLVSRSDRGDNLFTSMVAGALNHARDHDALDRLVSRV